MVLLLKIIKQYIIIVKKTGNLHVKVYDTYDFNPNEDNPLVVAGRNKMLKEELKPFFTIHDIIIPKEKLKELWKQIKTNLIRTQRLY